MSNWKTVDSRNFGITRAMIPQPSWVVLKILKSQGTFSWSLCLISLAGVVDAVHS